MKSLNQKSKFVSSFAIAQVVCLLGSASLAWSGEKLKTDEGDSALFTKKASVSDTAANLSAAAADLALAHEVAKYGRDETWLRELKPLRQRIGLNSKSYAFGMIAMETHPVASLASAILLFEGGMRIHEAYKGRDPGASPLLTLGKAVYDCKRPRPAIEVTATEVKKCDEALGEKPNVQNPNASSGR